MATPHSSCTNGSSLPRASPYPQIPNQPALVRVLVAVAVANGQSTNPRGNRVRWSTRTPDNELHERLTRRIHGGGLLAKTIGVTDFGLRTMPTHKKSRAVEGCLHVSTSTNEPFTSQDTRRCSDSIHNSLPLKCHVGRRCPRTQKKANKNPQYHWFLTGDNTPRSLHSEEYRGDVTRCPWKILAEMATTAPNMY